MKNAMVTALKVSSTESLSSPSELAGTDFSVTYYAAHGKANKIYLRASTISDADKWIKVLQSATGLQQT